MLEVRAWAHHIFVELVVHLKHTGTGGRALEEHAWVHLHPHTFAELVVHRQLAGTGDRAPEVHTGAQPHQHYLASPKEVVATEVVAMRGVPQY